MAEDAGKGDIPEVALDLDEQNTDLEAAMREAVAAVEASSRPPAAGAAPSEEVERLRRGGRPPTKPTRRPPPDVSHSLNGRPRAGPGIVEKSLRGATAAPLRVPH